MIRQAVTVGIACFLAAGVSAGHIRKPYHTPYTPGVIPRYYPENLVQLLNSTHDKDLKVIRDSRKEAFENLGEMLDSQTNDTEKLFARATERFEGTKDKVDKSFEGFQEKAAYQSKILAKRAAYANLKMKKTFNEIRSMSSSFQKAAVPEAPKPVLTKAAAKKEALLKPVAEQKEAMLSVYDKIAAKVDDEQDQALNHLKTDISDGGVVGKNFSKVRANETFYRLRYKHLLQKVRKTLTRVAPMFNSSVGEIKLSPKKHSTGPSSLEGAVSNLEHSLDSLNEIKDSANEASKRKVKKGGK
jgi:hypothetical protein|eukprot:g976.t1